MAFHPRTLSDGRVCCSSPTALCPACEEHFKGPKLTAYPRSARAMMPESPYDATLRYAEAVKSPPHIDPNYKPFGTPPNGYAIALAYRQAQEELEVPVIERPSTESRVLRYDRNNPPSPYGEAALAAHRGSW